MKVLWFANTPCGASEVLSPDLNLGGWLKSLEDQLVEDENIDLTICFYWGQNIAPFKHRKTFYYPVYRSRFYFFANKIFGYFNDDAELQNLIKIINKVNPDVIHVHGTEDNFGLLQGFIKLPLIISIQGVLSSYSEKYFSGIPATSAFLYEGLKQKLFFNSVLISHKRFLKRAIRERKILSQSNYIFGRTNWDKSISMVLSPKSRYFVGNEILRKSFYENHWRKENYSNPLRIVTIMSSGLYKGLETLVSTAKLLTELSDLKFSWTIIGQKDTDILPKIVRSWKNVDFKKLSINLVGNKNEKEIVDILVHSDIYCQVSHIENSPNSVCEAMLLGMPIIASFAGGTSSLISDSEGYLVQAGDSFGLAGTILECSKNFEIAANRALKGKKRALERHNPNQIAKDHINVYESII